MSTGRLARLVPSALDADQRAVYDEIAGGPRAVGPQLFRLVNDDGALEGPFNAFLLQPRLGSRLQELGSSIRYRTGLTDRQREMAILIVAAHWDSSFEWYAHEAIGRHVGLTDAELGAVRQRRFEELPAEGAMMARTAQRLVADADLDDAGYAEAVQGLGEAGLFEVITLVGYDAALALQLPAFRVPAPE